MCVHRGEAWMAQDILHGSSKGRPTFRCKGFCTEKLPLVCPASTFHLSPERRPETRQADSTEPATENLCGDDRGLRSHTTGSAQLPTAG
ncbi:uncharacterized protein LOC116744187 isoform X4 [Phocoena sinus]|uniref:uncharacterized protein LOC116744187 isoform X4 n=1 Tax=Phocoena sinus TaxID=42100 RepID=UPI0013C3FD00|nr:uncharacterized protein LOC116744187 isoform X4 [Phocoena sinus]